MAGHWWHQCIDIQFLVIKKLLNFSFNFNYTKFCKSGNEKCHAHYLYVKKVICTFKWALHMQNELGISFMHAKGNVLFKFCTKVHYECSNTCQCHRFKAREYNPER